MLADKHTGNACLFSNPSDQAARGVSAQDALARTPLWSTMMKVFPSGNGPRDPKQANGNDSKRLALSPQASICPPPPPRPPSNEPSQHDEPPIPGPSTSSEPPEDVATCEPEPEGAPTQSMEEPFGKSQLHFFNSSQLILTPPLPIFSPSRYSLLDHHHRRDPRLCHLPLLPRISLPLLLRTQPLPLIHAITLSRNSPTCDQH
ncbi:hypothetical protein O181_104421 [Austropuccinia psidii MF-1]|uniref:Uncharacterized protein n=1 Tax=Austropuccinia psidii MF-1 TaxID=1389203 RepID=A0A9Q3JM63_9BASI|nr:hypothetical protein [Austropuccinia psidii MF-1]